MDSLCLTIAPNNHYRIHVSTRSSTLDVEEDKLKVKADISAGAVIRPYLPLIDFHSAPSSLITRPHRISDSTRFTFRYWPRDPDGRPIEHCDVHGKEAGNGLDTWGATLYDFYFVRRVPSNADDLIVLSGSKLTKIMRALREFGHAQSEIAWAAGEGDPKEIPAWDPAEAISEYEYQVHADFDSQMNKKEDSPPRASVGGPEADAQIPDTSRLVTASQVAAPEEVTEVSEKDTKVPEEDAKVPEEYAEGSEEDAEGPLKDSKGLQEDAKISGEGAEGSEDAKVSEEDAEGSKEDIGDSGENIEDLEENSSGSEDVGCSEEEGSASGSDGSSADTTDKDGVQQCLPDIPVDSPFHPSHYPPPWPLVPFEGRNMPFRLRRGIPIHLLPKKLYVHDPWKVVEVNPDAPRVREKQPWASKPPCVCTYTLSLPPKSQKLAEAASKVAAAEDEMLKATETVFIRPRDTEGPTEEPAIRAFLPKRPRKPTEVPEAHLYLSPRGRLGSGNHSIVYAAELDLPRNLFCESTYCKTCLDDQIKVEVDRLKESGKWKKYLDEAAERYNGPGKYDATSSQSPSSSSVQIPPRYVGYVKERYEFVRNDTADVVTTEKMGESPATDAYFQRFRVTDPVINHYVEYEGLVISVHPNIQWQDPSFRETICEHQPEEKRPVPRVARFRIAAKLSLPGDRHLVREVGNYLKFPTHFFQHWTGYNVVPPLQDPTPIGALVPQFFGYYLPDGQDDEHAHPYRSPILLVEHCGRPISIHNLTIDERRECVSLLYRFHAAGWLHMSVAERNILVQKKHPTCNPLDDNDDDEERHWCDVPHEHRRYSFRLIDFGRSVLCEDPLRKSAEGFEGKALLRLA